MAKSIKKNETTNSSNIVMTGAVSLINYSSEKLFDGTVAINETTPKGNTMTHYVRVKWFNPAIELEKGDNVRIIGKFGTDSYESNNTKHYKLVVIVESCEVE